VLLKYGSLNVILHADEAEFCTVFTVLKHLTACGSGAYFNNTISSALSSSLFALDRVRRYFGTFLGESIKKLISFKRSLKIFTFLSFLILNCIILLVL